MASVYERTRAGIGFVPQGREIFARLTVEENLRMGLPSDDKIYREEHFQGARPVSVWGL